MNEQWGLSVEGAKLKWARDFADRTVRKDQVQELNDIGLPSGKKVWRIYVPVKYQTRDITYKDRG